MSSAILASQEKIFLLDNYRLSTVHLIDISVRHLERKLCSYFNFNVFIFLQMEKNWPVGRAEVHSSLEREVRGLNLVPVKSDTVFPTARHRCNVSSKEAMLPRSNDAEMGPANS